MKKYISVLLAAALSAALLAGCGSSKSIDKQPAPKANEQTAQAEQTAAELAKSTESAADSAVQTALAQTDAAQVVAGQETDADAQAGVYLIYVKDAETNAPVAGARVQFCSDVQCMMGKTDETGLAAFHSDPGKYTAHLLKAPEGYVTSTEEFELTEDSRTATYYLVKQGAEPATDQNSDVPKLQAEWDLPTTGLTITVPERFKEAAGQLWAVDRGEVDFGSGEVEAFILYQGRTDAEREEFSELPTAYAYA